MVRLYNSRKRYLHLQLAVACHVPKQPQQITTPSPSSLSFSRFYSSLNDGSLSCMDRQHEMLLPSFQVRFRTCSSSSIADDDDAKEDSQDSSNPIFPHSLSNFRNPQQRKQQLSSKVNFLVDASENNRWWIAARVGGWTTHLVY